MFQVKGSISLILRLAKLEPRRLGTLRKTFHIAPNP